MIKSAPLRVSRLVEAMAVAGLAIVPAVQAQQQAARNDETTQLDRVVITANKRIEPERNVAGSVSVLQGAQLEALGAKDQEDTLKLTPGVQFNKGDISSNTITIRGIGTETSNEGGGGQQQPTGFYVEDVPLVSPLGKGIVPDPFAFDLDRVEVLRGPQGALFGSGSLGGAVRYLFNKPKLDSFDASVLLSYAKVSGGDSAPSIAGMVNVPLATNTAGLRAVAWDREDPGYIDNLGTLTKDANKIRQKGARMLATVKPTAALSATWVVSTQDTKQSDTASVSPDPTKLEHTAPNNSARKVTADFSSLTVDWDLGAHTLTSVTGWWRNKATGLIDDTELFSSVGLVVPQVIRPSESRLSARSEELRIASNPGGPLSYVAGVFYQRSSGSGNAKQIDPSAFFGLTDLVDLSTVTTASETALFADAEYAFGGGWSVDLGGRHYRTRTHYVQTGTQFGAPSNITPPDSSDSGFTPKASLKYRLGDTGMWYATASKGYRYGGTNGTAPFKPFKSDSLWNYETGLRLNPAKGLQVDLSVFLLDWKDAQFTYFTVANGGLPESGIANVGHAKSKGIEASLRYRVSSAFDFSLSAAWTDAKTEVPVEVPNGRGALTAPAGSRLPGSPKFQAALQAGYRFSGPMGSSGRVFGTYAYVGDRIMYLSGNKPADAYDTLDLGSSFTVEHWTLSGMLSNVTNSKGVQSVTGAPAGVGSFAQYFLQRPRTLTVSLRYDY
ncbi:TonB-dependent receptor [Roseateles toxinivorans]|uniref:Outer membrane receptor protein involved in Fe transport n=1 Tax=Roseateles toxinivorans TaxID=270368 RepID=A0A4R6QGX8_9BURK|nr:TonB-dependent receptor [Roseateles toxinivorans]TDP61233.1 outer membrane receptor protein involved in Fe transport [Roseateles toxinivorans]